MLSQLLKTYFVATALSPICFSLAYIAYQRNNNIELCLLFISIAILLGASSFKIIEIAKTKLEILSVSIKKAKSTDKEVIGFFVAYVLPIVFKNSNFDVGSIAIFILLLAFVIWGTHSFQVNPLLGVFGYHFYEVDTESGITFVLVTKKKIVNVNSIGKVVQLTEYMVLEV
jgi:hypothetical protein